MNPSPAGHDSGPAPLRQPWLACLALAAVHAAVGVASLQIAWPEPLFFNASAGIALAALLRFGPSLLPGVWLGSFLIALHALDSLTGAFFVACGNSIGAFAATVLMQRVSRFQPQLQRLRDMASLIAFGVLGAAMIAALAGSLALAATGQLVGQPIGSAILTWWLADSAGVLLIAPLLLAITAPPRSRLPALKRLEAFALLSLQTGTAVAIMSGTLAHLLQVDRLNFLLLPVALAIALRHRTAFTATANIMLFALAALATARGYGPYAAAAMDNGALQLQFGLLAFAGITLIINAVSEERTAALASAKDNLARFRDLNELSADWYWEQDENYRFTLVSGGFRGLARLSAEQYIGRTRWEVLPAERTSIDWEAHRRLLEARESFDITFEYRSDGDQITHFQVAGRPIFDKDGEFRGYRGVGRDVTAATLAERNLRRSEERFRALTGLLADWYWEQDANLRFTFLSGANREWSGLGEDALIGKTRFELSNRFESDDARARHEIDLAQRRPFRDLILRADREDGEVRWASISGEPIFDDDGDFIGYRGTGRDVTAQKTAEAALRASSERFKDLTSLSSDWYWEQDAELRFTFLSAAVQEKTGIAARSRLGIRRWEVPGLVFDEASLARHKEQLDARLPFRDFSYRRIADDGREIWVSTSGKPIFDADGGFIGYRGIGRDITPERLAQLRMQRLRDCYAVLSEANNAIIHASEAQTLFDAICRVAVDHGRFQFAWIGALDSESQTLAPVAVAGDHRNYPYHLQLSADPDVVAGQGSAGDVLRGGEPVVVNDSLGDPRSAPWLDRMRAAGFRAHAIFALRDANRVFGTLHLYSAERDVFDPELIALLNRVAMNLSFALDGFERDAARNAAEQALRESERRFRDIAEVANEYVWENDREGRFTYVSPKVSDVLGYEVDELIGRSAAELMPPGEAERVRAWFRDHMKPGGAFRNLEHQIIAKSGETLWMNISGVPTWDAAGRRTGHRGTTRDITELKRSEARISYLATRDPLTELPNRLLFNDRLDQGVISARRAGDALGVLFIDLDRFKNINDSLGHHVGDLLLKEVAQRMSACIRSGDTLARLGGDEFVIALEQLHRAEDATQIAAKIVQALSRPIEVGGHALNTSCSIGISIFPVDADDGATLMKNADTAMYHAKEKGRNNFQFFSPDMNVRAVERHHLEVSLRQALERNEFTLLYQPQVAMDTGAVVGAEALIRWQHPERGLIAPGGFVGVAEETGLIEPIGRWVLREACAQAQRWHALGAGPMRVAVNISARQLLEPREFLRYVQQVLDETGLDPRNLELEMTESLLLQNVEDNVAMFRKLGRIGVHIAVDDFGTGYSSLAYLKQLPINNLKIDRTFVRDIESDPEDAAIITAIIALAHSLKLQVTAEGVESEGQLEALRGLGCDQYQGYLKSKPVTAAEYGQFFLGQPLLSVVRSKNTGDR
jgi:diguanylate cyclase (GGDEF)-like protein/PAS domain S-box-containing protein